MPGMRPNTPDREPQRRDSHRALRAMRRWFDTFNDRWDEIAAQGFDERFRRMWNMYLASCAGTFRGGNCDVTQITMARP